MIDYQRFSNPFQPLELDRSPGSHGHGRYHVEVYYVEDRESVTQEHHDDLATAIREARLYHRPGDGVYASVYDWETDRTVWEA